MFAESDRIPPLPPTDFQFRYVNRNLLIVDKSIEEKNSRDSNTMDTTFFVVILT